MPESEPNTDGAGSGGESDTAHSGMAMDKYGKWYEIGKSMEAAKDQGKSY